MKSREEPERIGTGTPEDWKTMSIDQVKARKPHALAMGPFGSNITTDNFVSSGVPVIRGNNLTGFRFNDSGFVFITEDKADELASSNAFPGDIVVTHRGTIGQVGILPANSKFPRYVVSQSQMKLTCDTLIANPDFVFYFLKSPQGQYLLLRNVSTTGVPAIAQPLTSLRNIQIGLPDLDEQKRITNILTSFDSKIELAIQTNTTMESFEQALFRHWFVDFEFPNEEGQPYKSSGGEMEDSILGLIPKGWSIGKIDDIADVVGGGTPSTKNPRYFAEPGRGIAWLTPKDLSGYEGKYIGRGASDITKEGLENSSATLVPTGTVLFTSRAPIGYMTIAENEISTNQGFKSLIPKGKTKTEYLYQYVKANLDIIKSRASGSTFGEISGSEMKKVPILIPPPPAVSCFEDLAKPLNALIMKNQKETSTLTETRDCLLPRLVSGEIRVSGTDRTNGVIS